MRAVVLAVLLLGILPVWFPVAAAQNLPQASLDVQISDLGRALVPARNETLPVIVTYRLPPGSQGAPDPDGPNATAPTRITLAVLQKPSWVTEAWVYPEVVWMDVSLVGAGKILQAQVSLNLTLEPLAPARQREALVVEAVAEPNGNIPGLRRESQPVSVRAAFVPALNVSPLNPEVIVPGGRWVGLAFVVRNDGNADVVARLTIASKPENSEVRIPETVDVPREGQASFTAEIRVPWTAAETGTLVISALPVMDDEAGEPAVAEVEVLGRSAVPGPGALVTLVAIVWALRVRRR